MAHGMWEMGEAKETRWWWWCEEKAGGGQARGKAAGVQGAGRCQGREIQEVGGEFQVGLGEGRGSQEMSEDSLGRGAQGMQGRLWKEGRGPC